MSDTIRALPVVYAKEYARRGWAVFPLHSVRNGGGCSCGDPSCRNPGKHPRTATGFKEATTDPEKIQTWWETWPDANIGVRTGRTETSALLCIDVDPRHGGNESLNSLEEKYGILPPHLIARTGGGGSHHIFTIPDGATIRSGTEKLGPGVDIKAEGGYFVAAPSSHASGSSYSWVNMDPILGEKAHRPEDNLPPVWLLDLLGVASRPRGGQGSTSLTERITEGARNDTLFRLASSLRSKGLTAEGIHAALLAENRARCSPPLPDDEVRQIAGSAGRYPAGDLPPAFTPPEITSDTLPYEAIPPLETRIEESNLIKRWIRVCSQRTDAYTDFHHATGLTLLGIIADKKIFIRTLQDTIYPNVWTFILAGSGSRKSTCIKFIKEHQSLLYTEKRAPIASSFSPEGLIEHLDATPHSYWLRDECAGILKAFKMKGYMAEGKELFLELFDSTPISRRIKKKRKGEQSFWSIQDPYINVIFGTTPASFSRHLEEDDILDGFLPRFLIYNPRGPRPEFKSISLMDEATRREYNEVGSALSKLMAFLEKVAVGGIPLSWSPESTALYSEWCRRLDERMDKHRNEVLSAFFSRAQIYVLKMAALYFMGSESFVREAADRMGEGTGMMSTLHSLEIPLEYLREAMRQMDEYFIPTARDAARYLALCDTKNNQVKIIKALERFGGEAPKEVIMRQTHLSRRDLLDAEEALQESEELVVIREDTRGRPRVRYQLISHDDGGGAYSP